MKSITKNQRGVVSIEFALILVLFVVPVAIAVAKLGPTVITWVEKTAANMERNSNLQEENNRLLQQLLQQQGNQSNGTSPQQPTNDPQGCDPTPGASKPC